jgi:hypothetical protein
MQLQDEADLYRYHSIVDNPYPNDDEEVTRLDELQYVIRCFFGRNILAPISRKPSRILDIGTGSGIKPLSNVINL